LAAVPTDLQWRYAAVADLRIREFEDAALVFQPLSWDAHLLNPAAMAVLELCMEGAPTQLDVEQFLADALEAGSRHGAAEHAALLLDELTRLGVIKPLSADATG